MEIRKPIVHMVSIVGHIFNENRAVDPCAKAVDPVSDGADPYWAVLLFKSRTSKLNTARARNSSSSTYPKISHPKVRMAPEPFHSEPFQIAHSLQILVAAITTYALRSVKPVRILCIFGEYRHRVNNQ